MNANLKVLHHHESHADEIHDYPEGLLVTDGEILLMVDGKSIAVNAGGMFIVPPGALHTVAEGHRGTLVIFN